MQPLSLSSQSVSVSGSKQHIDSDTDPDTDPENNNLSLLAAAKELTVEKVEERGREAKMDKPGRRGAAPGG